MRRPAKAAVKCFLDGRDAHNLALGARLGLSPAAARHRGDLFQLACRAGVSCCIHDLPRGWHRCLATTRSVGNRHIEDAKPVAPKMSQRAFWNVAMGGNHRHEDPFRAGSTGSLAGKIPAGHVC
jgi:hypothetical protein